MEFVFDFNWLIMGIVLVMAVIMVPKAIQNNRLGTTKSQKSLQKLDQEYIEELEWQLKKHKNKVNQMERGPAVTGEVSELSTLLPDIVGQFSQYAPKWLQPILSNPESSKWIMEYVEKNPEKATALFSKFIKKKSDKAEQVNSTVSGL